MPFLNPLRACEQKYTQSRCWKKDNESGGENPPCCDIAYRANAGHMQTRVSRSAQHAAWRRQTHGVHTNRRQSQTDPQKGCCQRLAPLLHEVSKKRDMMRVSRAKCGRASAHDSDLHRWQIHKMVTSCATAVTTALNVQTAPSLQRWQLFVVASS